MTGSSRNDLTSLNNHPPTQIFKASWILRHSKKYWVIDFPRDVMSSISMVVICEWEVWHLWGLSCWSQIYILQCNKMWVQELCVLQKIWIVLVIFPSCPEIFWHLSGRVLKPWVLDHYMYLMILNTGFFNPLRGSRIIETIYIQNFKHTEQSWFILKFGKLGPHISKTVREREQT